MVHLFFQRDRSTGLGARAKFWSKFEQNRYISGTAEASSCAFYFPDSDSDSDSDLAKIPNLNLPIADEDRSQIQIWDTTVKIWICFLCSSSAFCAKADVTLGILKGQFNKVHISRKVKPTKLQPSPAL